MNSHNEFGEFPSKITAKEWKKQTSPWACPKQDQTKTRHTTATQLAIQKITTQLNLTCSIATVLSKFVRYFKSFRAPICLIGLNFVP